MSEARTRLSELLRRVATGEEFTIARAGHPVARLLPVDLPKGPRVPGALKGRIRIADDFDDTPPDLEPEASEERLSEEYDDFYGTGRYPVENTISE